MVENPVFSGEVKRVIFTGENGFAVISLVTADPNEREIAVGSLARLAPGDFVHLYGERVENDRYGQQIAVVKFEIALPASRDGMIRYLKRFNGVGNTYATRVLDAFGDATIQTILDNPLAVHTIVPYQVAESLITGVAAERVRAVAHGQLLAWGLNSRQVETVFAAYLPADPCPFVTENPYCLADLEGIGFATADEVARRLGVAESAPQRIRAACTHVLGLAAAEGHTYLPIGILDQRACALLKLRVETLQAELVEMEIDKRVVVDGDAVYLAALFNIEYAVTNDLKRVITGEAGREEIAPGAATAGLEPDADQDAAVAIALSMKVSVITGGPGTGKSTITRRIVEAATRANWRVGLAAPTGRAAKRLAQLAGEEAKTIHRLLEYGPSSGWKRCRSYPLELDLVIVDEASMVNLALLYRLLDAIPTHCRLLIVGDVDQLPPIGAGAILRDIIASRSVPVARLRTVHRQAADSSILRNAHRVNQGAMPQAAEDKATGRPGGDYFFVRRQPDTATPLIVNMVTDAIPKRYSLDPRRDVMVLAPMKRGASGVFALNDALRLELNPPPVDWMQPPFVLRVGDKVMQTKNDYERWVFNGEVGFVEEIRERTETEPRLTIVRFMDRDNGNPLVSYDSTRNLQLAFASTIHKAQGSESPAVVLALQPEHYIMLNRSLLYTAMTRARDLLVIVGQDRAIELAVDDAGGAGRDRYSLLAERLRRALG